MALDLMTRLDPLRRTRCPFCLAPFAAYQLHIRCTSRECVQALEQNDANQLKRDPIRTRTELDLPREPEPDKALHNTWWTVPLHEPSRLFLRRWCDLLLLPDTLTCPKCHRSAGRRLCPNCHRDLPEGVLTSPTGQILIFGPQAVGKTTFLTVLLQEIRNDEKVDYRLGLRPINDEVRQRYQEYADVTYGPPQLLAGRNGAVRRDRQRPTQSLEVDRRCLKPLVYELISTSLGGRKPIASVWDLPGEDWEDRLDLLLREAGHLFRQAGGLLLLIDPLRIPQVAEKLDDLTEEEANARPYPFFEDPDKLAQFYSRLPVRTPLAICLNKIDRWGKLLSPTSILHQIACSVPTGKREDWPDGQIHEEIRSALRQWGQGEFLDRLNVDFPRHRFFACSAEGDAAQQRGQRRASEPAADATETGPTDGYRPLPTPLLVERPAIWLLKEQHVLPSRFDSSLPG